MEITDVKRSIKYLFDRPNEPLITTKGDDKAIFQLTQQHLPPEYKEDGLALVNGNSQGAKFKIRLVQLSSLPKLDNAKLLPRDAEFSLFLGWHQDMATEVIEALMNVPNNQLDEFLSTCVYCRANLNPQLFNYALCVALMHRSDTKDVPIQNFAESFPSKFVDSETFFKARRETTVFEDAKSRDPIMISRDYTASDLEIEHRVAYFREDLGINLHHWHWHMVYPFQATDRSIVAKDRRGELFYYMHHEIIARYNCERLDNQLKRVVKFDKWREPIPEAYFSKLDSLTSSRGWPPRQANARWQDVNRPVDRTTITISEMEGWRRNIEEAIATGFVILPDGTSRALDIDTLGNMMESSILTPNRTRYGNIHNSGHVFASYIHDPDHRYLESSSVMGDEAITMRDPFFYRWHSFIDDLFQKFKESTHIVLPYTPSELGFEGVRVTSASVRSSTGKQNIFETFWMQSDVDLSRGLDFSNRGAIYARFTHLNHKPFSYTINYNNSGRARRGTVRIFLAPKYDERKLPWSLFEQRKMFIQMDRFVVDLSPGQNTIVRQSTESSVTIPFEQTFRDLTVEGDEAKRKELTAFNFCGCGWPQHMLIPRGTVGGSAYQLFVMISNYELDKVDQPSSVGELNCKEASSYCGLKDRLYPDKRAMGFPFDRPSNTAKSIETFILPNMALVECTIKLNDITEPNPKNAKKNN